MSEMNEGVKIILARMETNPEDFFTVHKEYNPWRWIFDDSVREVMTEPEKAALFEGIKKVRRLMITHRALEAVMPKDEGEIGHIPPPPWKTEQMMKTEQMKMKLEQTKQIMQSQQNVLIQSQPNPYQNVGSGGTSAMSTSTGTGTLSVDGETIDSSMLKKLKSLIK